MTLALIVMQQGQKVDLSLHPRRGPSWGSAWIAKLRFLFPRRVPLKTSQLWETKQQLAMDGAPRTEKRGPPKDFIWDSKH